MPGVREAGFTLTDTLSGNEALIEREVRLTVSQFPPLVVEGVNVTLSKVFDVVVTARV